MNNYIVVMVCVVIVLDVIRLLKENLIKDYLDTSDQAGYRFGIAYLVGFISILIGKLYLVYYAITNWLKY